MSFPRYPEYKDSGVEWLGKVPAHWEVVKLSYLAISKGGGTPPKDELQYWNGSIPWVTPKDMKQQWITSTIDTLSEAALHASPVSMVEPGHVLIVFRSGILRHRIPVAINKVSVTVNQDVRAYDVSPRLLPDFFLRLVQGLNRELLPEWSKQGATVESLESELVNSTQLPVPSRSEQEAITAFLEHETAHIDALVEEQKRLVELLKEKRQAVISHAVTKGLDPDVPMKDSGVEWLGEVPAHWVRKRLKNVSPFITVGIVVNPSSYLAEEGLPFIYGGEVREGYIEVDKARKISVEDSRRNRKTMLEAGDVVTMRVGYPGVTSVVPPECEGGNCASVMLIKKGGYDSRWLCALMNSRLIRHQVEVVQYGAAQKQFNIADAVEFWLFEPPLDEQASIADYIDDESSRFDQLVDEAILNMDLLKERRFALISAAVTGKIDVRGWQPPPGSMSTTKTIKTEVV